MSDPATSRIEQSALKEMIFTNSIPYDKGGKNINCLSVAPMFAEAIRRVIEHESISDLYDI